MFSVLTLQLEDILVQRKLVFYKDKLNSHKKLQLQPITYDFQPQQVTCINDRFGGSYPRWSCDSDMEDVKLTEYLVECEFVHGTFYEENSCFLSYNLVFPQNSEHNKYPKQQTYTKKFNQYKNYFQNGFANNKLNHPLIKKDVQLMQFEHGYTTYNSTESQLRPLQGNLIELELAQCRQINQGNWSCSTPQAVTFKKADVKCQPIKDDYYGSGSCYLEYIAEPYSKQTDLISQYSVYAVSGAAIIIVSVLFCVCYKNKKDQQDE